MTQSDDDAEWDEDDIPEWTDQVMATVATEVRRRRKELGWSAQELADTCADLGHPIPRNVIANMESGRRSTLPLVDVIVLAAALDTSPILLLYPLGYTARIQKLPLTEAVTTWEALRWFTGEAGDSFGMEDQMLRNFRAHQHHQASALAAVRDADYAQWQARSANTPEKREDAQRRANNFAREAAHHTKRLRNARSFIEKAGGTPPYPDPQLHDTETGDPETDGAQPEELP